jgi:hypothetical protein
MISKFHAWMIAEFSPSRDGRFFYDSNLGVYNVTICKNLNDSKYPCQLISGHEMRISEQMNLKNYEIGLFLNTQAIYRGQLLNTIYFRDILYTVGVACLTGVIIRKLPPFLSFRPQLFSDRLLKHSSRIGAIGNAVLYDSQITEQKYEKDEVKCDFKAMENIYNNYHLKQLMTYKQFMRLPNNLRSQLVPGFGDENANSPDRRAPLRFKQLVKATKLFDDF